LWWKVNSVSYLNLSCVARNALAIQSSIINSESAFTEGHLLDRFRSSLTPTITEVLICYQNCLRSSKASNEIEERYGKFVDRYSFYKYV
ncbi:zinc finger bed domain-containing protein ricesleeper 2, partial [Phtheirospermum japonicum]